MRVSQGVPWNLVDTSQVHFFCFWDISRCLPDAPLFSNCKLNTHDGTDTGRMHRMWTPQTWSETCDILVVLTGVDEWVKVQAGDEIPYGAVSAGEGLFVSTYPCRDADTELGTLTAELNGSVRDMRYHSKRGRKVKEADG